MVKKSQKAKSTSSTSTKRNATKTEKLSNGFKDNEKQKTKNKAKVKTTENESDSSLKVDTLQDTQGQIIKENVTDTAKPGTSRKRKTTENVINKEKPTKTTKSKKQKVLIEIPRINLRIGQVFGIGNNESGQLGFNEDVEEKPKPALLDLPNSIADIAAGAMHSVCLAANGEVITFGCNDEGALGRIAEEGTEFTPLKVDIPESIVQISAGDSHSAALSESGHVYVWGNFRNQTGPIGLIAEGVKQCTPVRILNDITVVQISSGSDHLACLSQEGDVYTFGNAEAGQLGRISERLSVNGGRQGMGVLLTPSKVFVPNCSIDNIWTGSFSTFLKIQQSGLIYAFGLNNYGQLGLRNLNENPDENPKPIFVPRKIESFNNKKWKKVSGGLNHTLALEENGIVYSLGRSLYGMLGLGSDYGDQSEPIAVPSLQEEQCEDISCGNSVSYAVTRNGSAFSWGFGTNNQLGHGNDDDQFVPKLIEGNFFKSWKAIKIAGGGQHALILAQPRNTSEKNK